MEKYLPYPLPAVYEVIDENVTVVSRIISLNDGKLNTHSLLSYCVFLDLPIAKLSNKLSLSRH
jgi:hypothetical protein